MLTFNSEQPLCRSSVLLAPANADRSSIPQVDVNPTRHQSLLASAQRLRANVYLEINALNPAQLTPDARHIQEADADAYHLLTLDRDQRVAACARLVLHDGTASYSDLTVSRTALAKTPGWGERLRAAVEGELYSAKERSLSCAELGGWAIAPALRHTTEALRTMLSLYILSERLGGVIGITTARRACSAPILRRIGGRSVEADGVPMPAYFDPQYRCEVEVIRFDSTQPISKFERMMTALRDHFTDIPVIAPA